MHAETYMSVTVLALLEACQRICWVGRVTADDGGSGVGPASLSVVLLLLLLAQLLLQQIEWLEWKHQPLDGKYQPYLFTLKCS